MTVRLRPHHLLCMLTYVGEGYGPAFTANYDRIAERLGKDEDVLIVSGPDDICAPLLGNPDAHCLLVGIDERDRLAAQDVEALLSIPIRAGCRLDIGQATLLRMRAAFASGETRTACGGCEWAALCSDVAQGAFRKSLVRHHGWSSRIMEV